MARKIYEVQFIILKSDAPCQTRIHLDMNPSENSVVFGLTNSEQNDAGNCEQTFEAYPNGLSSLVDVSSARRELNKVHYTQLDMRATLASSWTPTASLNIWPRFILIRLNRTNRL
jgi:hypothetical protein